jgi:hypothetical protein
MWNQSLLVAQCAGGSQSSRQKEAVCLPVIVEDIRVNKAVGSIWNIAEQGLAFEQVILR